MVRQTRVTTHSQRDKNTPAAGTILSCSMNFSSSTRLASLLPIFLFRHKIPKGTAHVLEDCNSKVTFFCQMPEDQPSRAVVNRVKRIAPGARVSGKFGELLPSSDGKHWKQARVFSNVIEATAANKYQVQFDNNMTLECFSNSLRVEGASASTPPDIPPPPTKYHSNNPFEVQCQEDALQQFEADIQEQEEEEHLPTATPEGDEELDTINEDVEQEQEDQVLPGAAENPDPEGRMPGQLPAAVEAVQPDFHSRKRAALEKVHGLIGKEVVIKSGRDEIRWTVVCNHDPPPEDCLAHNESNTPLGLEKFVVSNHQQHEVLSSLFLHLSFIDWKSKVLLLNEAIHRSKAKVKQFSASEFLIGLGLLIGYAEFAQNGKDLFVSQDQKKHTEVEIETWSSLISHP